jgi:subtilisin family serine protease
MKPFFKQAIIFGLTIILVIPLFSSGSITNAAASSAIVIDPQVQAAMNDLQPGEMLTVIVTLKDQADLSRIPGASRAARQQGVILALQAKANATQGRLTGLLNSYQAQGLVDDFTALWVFNGFSVTGTSDVINALVQDSEVLKITLDDIQIAAAAGPPEPNISLVNAPALWSQGYSGQGVVVASMDSGVDVSHPDLANRWRGGTNSWFDPYNQHSTPVDLSGHGTWTTGIMVGGDAGGTSVGVAPGAQWIAVKIFNDQGGSTATAIHQGFQWLLDPDGNPNTADAPQVVNNSWTFAYPSCDLEFELDLQSLRAAGILPVFATGNGGPSGSTSYSPGNNPSAFAVGAIDNNSQIYAYSSRGPSTCGGSTGPFPEVVAPGVNIFTTGLYSTYHTDSGTSFAAPHVAGGLALLLSAYPNLDASTQEGALISSAVDLGASGPDDVFGFGRVDFLSALNWVATAPTPTPTVIPNVNLALNQTATVSSFQDSAYSGAAAVDGSLSTLWQTQKAKGKNRLSSEWIEVDLGSNQYISQVTLKWDAYYATAYSIDVSHDGSAWSTVFSTSSGDGGNDTLVFDTVQARYIRMSSTAWSNNSNRNWLKEFEAYPFVSAPTPTPTAATEPTATPSPTFTPAPTPTMTPPPSGETIHIGDMDGSRSPGSRNRWNALVMVAIHDGIENPVSGVTITGSWSTGGSDSCVTDILGQCSLGKNNLKGNQQSVTFTVDNISYPEYSYQSDDNHDPDGDSNGTTIVISKP